MAARVRGFVTAPASPTLACPGIILCHRGSRVLLQGQLYRRIAEWRWMLLIWQPQKWIQAEPGKGRSTARCPRSSLTASTDSAGRLWFRAQIDKSVVAAGDT